MSILGFYMLDQVETILEEDVEVIEFLPTNSNKHLESIDIYLKKIRSYPMISQKDEYEAITRWKEHRDSRALEKITHSHLRLAAKISAGYMGYGLPFDDLLSEASLGIIKAIDRFDIHREVRFSTYASWWMHAAIKDYVLRMWSSVRLGTSASQKKLFFQLRSLKQKLRSIEDNEIPDDYIQQISQQLDIPEKEVRDMGLRMAGQDYSLNVALGEEDGMEWQDVLEDDVLNQEDKMVSDNFDHKKSMLLRQALEALDEREYVIFYRRNLTENPSTLQTLSTELSISRERVRQIEEKAMLKVTRTIKSKALEQRIISY